MWNATAAAALAASCGISKEAIADALKTFKSVKRRLEVKAQVNGITIIDDFAHHPTAIAGTLKALRARYAGARLWAILEPRSNTLRRRVLQSDLARSLAQADEVIVAGSLSLRSSARKRAPGITRARRRDRAKRPSGAPSWPTPTRSSRPSPLKCAAEMSSPFFPMAASAAFMKNCRRACANSGG